MERPKSIEIIIRKIQNGHYDGTLYNVYMISCEGEYIATVRYEEHKNMILQDLLNHNKEIKVIVAEK